MVCECGTVFCFDNADLTMFGGGEKLFCSKDCERENFHRRQGKIPYPGANAARNAAAKLLRKEGRVLYPYPCAHCPFWHLTKHSQDSPAFKVWLSREAALSH